MVEPSWESLVAGLLAYAVGFLVGVVPLVHWTLFQIARTKVKEEDLLLAGNSAIAIDLGSTMLCQAILARHAVFAIMAVVRALFVENPSGAEAGGVLFRSFLVFLALTGISFFSVWLAGRFFRSMTRRLDEEAAIRKGNVAVAIFSALALLAITVILSDGMEDLSRSLIPYARAGITPWQ